MWWEGGPTENGAQGPGLGRMECALGFRKAVAGFETLTAKMRLGWTGD